MTIQTDLQSVTDRIIAARSDVAHCEVRQARLTHFLSRDEAELTRAQREAMFESTGANDTARRVYADSVTARQREIVAETAAELLDIEIRLIHAKAELASATDQRRLLETLVRLSETGTPVNAFATANHSRNGSDDGEVEFTF